MGKPESFPKIFGAGKETRTLDLYLGKVSLYQLSYSRKTEGRIIEIYFFVSRKFRKKINEIAINFYSTDSTLSRLYNARRFMNREKHLFCSSLPGW